MPPSAVGAVVVTFNPDAHVGERLARIASQVERLVVVDNASDPAALAMLAALSASPRLELIRNDTNRGVATALNQGVARLVANGCDWVWLFDQDSTPAERMLETQLSVFDRVPDRGALAIVGADVANARQWSGNDPAWKDHPLWVERQSVITSGSLLPVRVLQRLGPFRDDFFIDHVDTEYCLRARSQGLKVVALRDAQMGHAIGAPATHRVGTRTTTTSNHAASRRYYMTRNLTAVLRSYWRTDPQWAVGAVVAWVKAMVLMLVFERQRPAKLRATRRGLLDGLEMPAASAPTPPP